MAFIKIFNIAAKVIGGSSPSKENVLEDILKIEVNKDPKKPYALTGRGSFNIKMTTEQGVEVVRKVDITVLCDLIKGEMFHTDLVSLNKDQVFVITGYQIGCSDDLLDYVQKARCEICKHKQTPDGGHCYMFKDFMENCGAFVPV